MKLYVIVRNDLRPGLQLAQGIHAARQFQADYPTLDQDWHDNSNNIVVLQEPDEAALTEIVAKLVLRDVRVSIFREPDLGDEVTAVAAYGYNAQQILSDRPLALRGVKKAA
jgi:hypothetical protein